MKKMMKPTLLVYNDFFSEREVEALRRLARTVDESMYIKVDDEPKFKTNILQVIRETVLAHEPNTKYIEIWSQPCGGSIEWHTDKDEELFHRTRVLRHPDRSFVAYIGNARHGNRGLLLCGDEKHSQADADDFCMRGHDRVANSEKRLVVFAPDLAHRVVTQKDDSGCSGHRSLLFNAWGSHIPEGVRRMEFAQGPEADIIAERGRRMRRLMERRLRPGVFLPHQTSSNLLFQAVANNDAKKVNELLDVGVFADEARTDGCNAFLTPLHVAAAVGNADIVASLIDRGKAWVNMLDRDGRSPLRIAVTALSRASGVSNLTKLKSAVHLLAEKGSHADAATVRMYHKMFGERVFKSKKNKTGSAIADALDADNMVMLENVLLASRRFAVMKDASTGETPLQQATRKGNLRAVRLLMRHGARPDRSRGIALMSAVCEGFRDIAFELLRKGGARVPAKSVPDVGTATSPLHCAAERGDIELVESLIRVGGADVNKRDRAGRSALHLAAMEAGPHARTNYQPNISSYLRVIEALIKHGAVVEADGYSAIVPSHATTEKLLRNLNFLP
eukprot:g2727.t1